MKTKKQQAIEVLVKYGLLIPMENQTLYHGRASAAGEKDWDVDPDFNNAGNSTGNNNLGEISTLYTTVNIEDARKYALREARNKNGTSEIHVILPKRKGYYIWNCMFDWTGLTKEQAKECRQAISTLLDDNVTKYMPVSFEERDIAKAVHAEIVSLAGNDFSKLCDLVINKFDETVETISNNPKLLRTWNKTFGTGKEELHKFVQKIMKGYSTRVALMLSPGRVMLAYLEGETEIYTQDRWMHIDAEYVKNWAAQYGIIGLKSVVDSKKISKLVDTYAIFDLNKVMRKEYKLNRDQQLQQVYGKLGENLDGIIPDRETSCFLADASPEEIMTWIYQKPALRELYQQQAGVWEGWNVAQHTVAVMDFFERNYKDRIPEQLQPVMKLIMLVHDIGKGYRNQYNNQQEANIDKAEILYDELAVPYNLRGLINFIITESQEYTSAFYLNRNYRYHTPAEIEQNKKAILKKLENRCKEELKKALGREPSAEEVKALSFLCEILQTCDSGAYTRYARVKDSTIYCYAGNDSFTKSFKMTKGSIPMMRTYKDDLGKEI